MCKSIGLNGRLWIGLLFFSTWLILVEYIIPFGSFDTGPASSLVTVFTGLFLGAIISKAIYDHINRESQKRQWKHDYALIRVKEIYAPLWDEAQDALTALRNFRLPRDLRSESRSVDGVRDGQIGFGQVMDSHLGLFVDGDAKGLLQQFHDSVDGYRQRYSTADGDIYKVAEQNALRVLKEYKSQAGRSEMIEAFRQWPQVVFDPQAVVNDSRDRYSHAHEFFSHSRQAAFKDYGETLTALRDLEYVEIVRDANVVAIAKGEKALSRLREIISDPSNVVLDFDKD